MSTRATRLRTTSCRMAVVKAVAEPPGGRQTRTASDPASVVVEDEALEGGGNRGVVTTSSSFSLDASRGASPCNIRLSLSTVASDQALSCRCNALSSAALVGGEDGRCV
eukprot:TRINITY_DN8209_c0_g1_i1.p5 TRINITY_DN8209_c0_g1~~TRINITY_DN8209_c0_g1_i1.p5  ORF type:complete len:109 (-),score=8.92 TRINITY_DN8209_c0_g1_i1:2244-2570(-)